MIEAIEVHEMQITKPVPVQMQMPSGVVRIDLTHPFDTGVKFGMGLVCAPIILGLFALFGLILIKLTFY